MSKDERPAQFEPDRKLRRAARYYNSQNELVPHDVMAEVLGLLQAGIARQHIRPGETLPEMVQRVCPHVHAAAAKHGYELDLNLEENTNENLAWGKVFYVLRRLARH